MSRCLHPRCMKEVPAQTVRAGRRIYCLEHGSARWAQWRYQRGIAPTRGPKGATVGYRSSAAIRADLAEQLAAMLGRFQGIVARDRRIDPIA